MQKYMIAGMIIFGIFACGMCACIVCGYKSLKLAIDTIDASADFLARTKRIIFVPVFYFVLSFVVSIVWLYAFLNVFSIGDVKP